MYSKTYTDEWRAIPSWDRRALLGRIAATHTSVLTTPIHRANKHVRLPQ